MNILDRYRPQYTHDCDACRFIFREGEMDLYWCNGAGGGSVIVRKGDEPFCYYSADVMTVLMTDADSPVVKICRKVVAYITRHGILDISVNNEQLEAWDLAFKD
jgi:hypothetical protein